MFSAAVLKFIFYLINPVCQFIITSLNAFEVTDVLTNNKP